MIEMDEILTFLEKRDSDKVKLFFIKETKRPEISYLLYRAPIDKELGLQLRRIATEQIQQLSKSAAIMAYSDYGDVSGSDQPRVVRIGTDQVQNLPQIMEEFNHGDLEAIDAKKKSKECLDM